VSPRRQCKIDTAATTAQMHQNSIRSVWYACDLPTDDPLCNRDVREWLSSFNIPFPSHSHLFNSHSLPSPFPFSQRYSCEQIKLPVVLFTIYTRHAIFNTLVIVICSLSNRHQLLSQPKMLASEVQSQGDSRFTVINYAKHQ